MGRTSTVSRGLVALTAAVSFSVTAAGSAFAWSLSSGAASFGDDPSRDTCYSRETTLYTFEGEAINMADTVAHYLNSSGTCFTALANDPAPAGWLGARSWIIRGDGTICRVEPWYYTQQKSLEALNYTSGLPKSQCNGNIQGRGRSKGYSPALGDYITSNFVWSPAHSW